MKRIISIFMTMIILMLSCVVATANSFVDSNTNQNAFMLTETCPQDVVDFAKTSIDSFPYMNEYANSQIVLGEPFTLTNEKINNTVYYFPVIIDGEIEYTYRIFYSNGWQYVLSECLADELNYAAEHSTITAPTIIYLNDDDNIVVQNQNYESIFVVESVSDNVIASSTSEILPYSEAIVKLKENKTTKTINSFSSIKVVDDSTASTYSAKASSAKSKYLSPTIREQQGSLPWCAAYVTAFIVSYKTGTAYYAREVAQFAGASESEGISISKCVKFAKDKGLSNTRQTIFDASDNTMMKQIDNNCPVYVGANNKNTDGSHALAVIGYSWSGSAITNWRIWNPWYNSFENISSREYTAPNGYEYEEWEYFIIDFNND